MIVIPNLFQPKFLKVNTLSDISIELIGSGLTLIVALFWQKGIVPFFENLVYRGIRIDGNWTLQQQMKSTADGTTIGTKRDTVLEITQKATKISGTATSILKSDDSTQDFIYYTINGEVKDRFVTLILKCRKKDRIAYSTFLLEVVSDGYKMVGYRTFYGLKRQKINATSCVLNKGSD